MKIEIKTNKNSLWLESDNHAFIVHFGFTEYKDKKGEIQINRINPKYCSTLVQAFHVIINHGLLQSEAKTLTELKADIMYLEFQLEKLVKY